MPRAAPSGIDNRTTRTETSEGACPSQLVMIASHGARARHALEAMKSLRMPAGGALVASTLLALVGPTPEGHAADTAKAAASTSATLAASPPAIGGTGAANPGAGVQIAQGSGDPAAERASRGVRRLEEAAANVRALLSEQLDPKLDPRTLFDVNLDDADAVAVEAARLELFFVPADAGADAIPAPSAKSAKSARTKPGVTAPDGGVGGSSATDVTATDVDAAELDARLELDRARLEFYRLAEAERRRLLEAHERRRTTEGQSKAERELDAADAKVRAADDERRRALDTARAARTEALRAVGEERARLLAVAQRQAEFERELVGARAALDQLVESVLGWDRRVREMIESAQTGEVGPKQVDAFYLELRKELRASRDQLAEALGTLRTESRVPIAGEDLLPELPAELDQREVRAERARVGREAERLQALERELREAATRSYYTNVVALNEDRLALYPYLSEPLRRSIAGFTAVGLDQARAELRQVLLVLQYRVFVTNRFLARLARPGFLQSGGALSALVVFLKWLFPLLLFLWWRSRSQETLREWHAAARMARRKAHEVLRSPAERLLGVLERVHRPLEWLLLVLTVLWVLPEQARTQLEVQLVATALLWTLGGAAAVATIDAFASQRERGVRASRLVTAHVRLRSLRLVGYVVVVLALILSISVRLVGRGTLHDWVLSSLWLVAIPVGVVILRWWREIIFERIGQRRRRSALAEWALRRRSGWLGLPAAFVAGVELLVTELSRSVRLWVSEFDLTRRVLAYLFRRDLSRKAESAARVYDRLPAELFQELGPETASEELVEVALDREEKVLLERLAATGGGVFAVVGERGAGKSTLLGRIAAASPATVRVACPPGGAGAFASVLARATGLSATASLDESGAALDAMGDKAAVLIDDAHRLILPKMGGLEAFDEVLAFARRHSSRCAWVFAFDEVIWRFLLRARGARPLFDEVTRLDAWDEMAIVQLLQGRVRQAGIRPRFDVLVNDLPEDADALDVQEAADRTASAYYRLLWDYAAGNPGVALHAFRSCLGLLPDGSVAVKIFDAPDPRELELLPDPAVFVLRAVIQLEMAGRDDVVSVTMLRPAEVENALRYGLARSHFVCVDGWYRITWGWFRPVTRYLRRRYLLV